MYKEIWFRSCLIVSTIICKWLKPGRQKKTNRIKYSMRSKRYNGKENTYLSIFWTIRSTELERQEIGRREEISKWWRQSKLRLVVVKRERVPKRSSRFRCTREGGMRTDLIPTPKEVTPLTRRHIVVLLN